MAMTPQNLLEGLARQLGVTLDALLDPQGCRLTFDEAPDLELHWCTREEVLVMAALVGHTVASTRQELHLAALLLNPVVNREQDMALALDAATGRLFLRRAVALERQDAQTLTASVNQVLDRCAQLRQAWRSQGLVAS